MRVAIKQGDTRHAIRGLLKNNGNIVDLTGATVQFKMFSRYSKTLIDSPATIETDGTVQYVFTDGETDVTGLYDAEFLVTYTDDRVETFPHEGFIKIYIESRIGGI